MSLFRNPSAVLAGLIVLLLAHSAWAQSAPAAGAGETSPSRIEIRILPRVEVPGESFTLGEVAELDGFDMEAVQALANVQLGKSPRPGQALQLHRSFLLSVLGRVTDPERIRLVLPPDAQVLRATQVVPADEISARVLARAGQDVPDQSGSLTQKVLHEVHDVRVPMGELEWRIEQVGNTLSGGGTRMYKVEVQSHGETAWQGMVRVQQQLVQPVVVAARYIRRNRVIQAGDVTVLEKDVSRYKPDSFLTDVNQVIGRKAKRPIGRSEQLRSDLVEARTDLAEGGRVVLVYRTPQLTFRALGVAMVPGKVGAFIPVRNLQSGKIVYGVVQPDETVKVN